MITPETKKLLIQLKGFNGTKTSSTKNLKYTIILFLFNSIFGGYLLYQIIPDYLGLREEPTISTPLLAFYVFIMLMVLIVGFLFYLKDTKIREENTKDFLIEFKKSFPKINLKENHSNLINFITLIDQDGNIKDMNNNSIDEIEKLMLKEIERT